MLIVPRPPFRRPDGNRPCADRPSFLKAIPSRTGSAAHCSPARIGSLNETTGERVGQQLTWQ